MITANRLRELLDYDPETGVFTWRVKRTGGTNAGMRAGSLNNHGHLQIKVDGVVMAAHRLAWLHSYGHWPAGDLDHKNRDRADNHLANLRPATKKENGQNRKLDKRSTTGVTGVTRLHNGRLRAKIVHCQKTIMLGTFATIEEARAARLNAERDLGWTHAAG